MSNNRSHNITIREATPFDVPALARLAGRDSASVPVRPLLVGFVGDELLAAVSTVDGAAIADPFHPTAELVAMLRIEAGVHVKRAGGLGAYRRLWHRSPRPAGPSAPSVPGFPVIPGHTL